ncbi:MAG: hypothetical protein Q4E75_01680 [bacterium]|nr:hypothetical protein [bacterium]
MFTIKDKVKKVIDISSNLVVPSKFNVNIPIEEFDPRKVLEECLIDKEITNYSLNDCDIEICLLLLKYPKDEIIAFDEYESFIMMKIDMDNNNYLLNNLWSYKTNDYESALKDFNIKKSKIKEKKLDEVLDIIITENA